jgi:mitogen-activated protein kinase kinase kinase 1
MPNYIVGGICRSLEQPQYNSSGSSGHSPSESSKALQHQASFWKGFILFLRHLHSIYSRNIYFSQIIFDGENNEHGDTNYDSDEAESRPEDLVDEDNFAAVLSQLSNAPKEESEGYGESGHGMHEEKSLAESVGSLNFGVVDLESVDSTPQNHDKESYSTHCATDQCSRTKTAKCSLSSEVSDSISSHLAFESSKNDPELNAHPVEDSERIYDGHAKYLDHSIQGNGGTLADHPKKESADIQKDTGTMNLHCDALACDRESVCSSCEELRYGLNGEPPDSSSESHSGLNPTHTTDGNLPMVSDPVNNIKPSMTGMENNGPSEELNELRDTNEMVPPETHKTSMSLDHSIQGNGGTLADHPKKERADIQKDTGTMNLHFDALACDKESVCSSCEESSYVLNGEPSDSGFESHSGLNPTHTTSCNLPMFSEDMMNNIEPSMSEMTNNSTNEELSPEFSDMNQMVPPETHMISLSSQLPMFSEDLVNDIEPSMSGMTNGSTSEEPNPEFSDTNQMVPPETHNISLVPLIINHGFFTKHY